MKKGGKAGAGVGKKKAGVGGKKAGIGLKLGEKPLLSAAESLAIQSAVLPPEIPKPEESKAQIEPLQAADSPLEATESPVQALETIENPLQPAESALEDPISTPDSPSKAPEAVEKEGNRLDEEGTGKAEDPLPLVIAQCSDTPLRLEGQETPTDAEEMMKTEVVLAEESPSLQPTEGVEEGKAEETLIEASREEEAKPGEIAPEAEEPEEALAVETKEVTIVEDEPRDIQAHEESPMGFNATNMEFGEEIRIDFLVETEKEPEKPEYPPSDPPIIVTSSVEVPSSPIVEAAAPLSQSPPASKPLSQPPVSTEPLPLPSPTPSLPLPKAQLVDTSVQTPLPPSTEPRVIVTSPAGSPPRAASPIISTRSKGHSQRPSTEFPAAPAISRFTTETYESLDDFASKVDPPLKKFPTFQPDSSDMMSFDEFLTTIDEPSKPTKSLRSSINVSARQEEEVKPKLVQFQQTKMALKRVSVKPVDPEIDKMKQLAKEKEVKRAIRVQAATKIQARIRGILARKRYLVLRKRYEKVKSRERLAQLREAIRVSWAPYRIYKALKVRKQTDLAGKAKGKASRSVPPLPTPLCGVDSEGLPRICGSKGAQTCAKSTFARENSTSSGSNRLENTENTEVSQGEKHYFSVEGNDGFNWG